MPGRQSEAYVRHNAAPCRNAFIEYIHAQIRYRQVCVYTCHHKGLRQSRIYWLNRTLRPIDLSASPITAELAIAISIATNGPQTISGFESIPASERLVRSSR